MVVLTYLHFLQFLSFWILVSSISRPLLHHDASACLPTSVSEASAARRSAWLTWATHLAAASSWTLNALPLLLVNVLLVQRERVDLAHCLALTLAAAAVLDQGRLLPLLEAIRISVVGVDVWGLGAVLRRCPLLLASHLVFGRCPCDLLPRHEALAVLLQLAFVIHEFALDLDRRLWRLLGLIVLRHILVPVWPLAVSRSPQNLRPAPQLRRDIAAEFLLGSVVGIATWITVMLLV